MHRPTSLLDTPIFITLGTWGSFARVGSLELVSDLFCYFHSSTTSAKKILHHVNVPKSTCLLDSPHLVTQLSLFIPGWLPHRDEKRGMEIKNSSTRISVDASDTISDFW